jgi:hypothetical protein
MRRSQIRAVMYRKVRAVVKMMPMFSIRQKHRRSIMLACRISIRSDLISQGARDVGCGVGNLARFFVECRVCRPMLLASRPIHSCNLGASKLSFAMDCYIT